MKRLGKVLQVFRLRHGWLSILGVASIVVAGSLVASWFGYTLAGIGLIALDEMLFGGSDANPGRRIP